MSTVWTVIGAGLFCPVTVSRLPDQVALFARSATGELMYQQRTGLTWGPRQPLGIPVAYSPGSDLPVPVDWQLAGCTGAESEIDLFARSPDGDLLHMSGTPDGWGTFECLGAPAEVRERVAVPVGLASPPAACRSGPATIDVFARGPHGDVLHASKGPDGWSGFESLDAPPLPPTRVQQVASIEAVAACGCGASRMAVFLRGAQGDLLLKWWDGTRWSEYASLGSPEVPDESYPVVTMAASLMGPPAACSWGPERIDVFARGPRGDLVHKWWDGDDWSPFQSLGMPFVNGRVVPFSGTVAACSSGANCLDVLAGAIDGRLYHARWEGTWQHGETAPTPATEMPA